MRQLAVFALLLGLVSNGIASQFPPTTSKDSTDSNNVVTFNYAFPNFTGTHSGITFSLGVNGVAGGGTGSSAFSAGSILFSNGSIITQDNSQFYWNDTNHYLGIGTNTPSSVLTAVGSSAGGIYLSLQNLSTNGAAVSFIQSQNSSGSVASLGAFNVGAPAAYLSNNAQLGATNSIYVMPNSTSPSGATGTVTFLTGGFNDAPTMTITGGNPGSVGIGTVSPAYPLSVNGTVGVSNILINGSSSGYVLQTAPATVTSYFVTWPSAQGTGFLTNNGAGALSWSGSTVPVLAHSEQNSTATVSTTSTTDVLMTGMTVTPAAGTYLVMFSSWCNQSNGADTIVISLYNGSTLQTGTTRSLIPFPNNLLVSTLNIPVATQAIMTATGSAAISVEWHVNGGTGSCYDRTFDLVRIQ